MKNNYLNIALIMGAGLIAGALNYAYYPLMLQYMSLEDFGVFGSIMGILNLI
jgi:O-antigen/teichoic acid export membrane protein